MSLVIKKFQEGGSPEVRRYKRGNDEVDLDAFVRQAEAGFNDWLDKADIKEKHKKEVRAAYQDMITRINNDPESFAARLGGGFTNTAGITNKTKGFDAYGVAAGYLGNTLRSMSVYQKPEVKSDKQKYTRISKLITPDLQNAIVGTDYNSFIKLDDDSYNDSTGTRGLTHRINSLKKSLSENTDLIIGGRSYDSEEDREHAKQRIASAIETLSDEDPNNDWFALEQLGFTGMDKFLSTGSEKRTTPLTPEEQQALGSQANLRDFENWMSSNRPFYMGALDKIPISSTNGTANSQQVTELTNKLRSLSNNDLKNWIYDYIENPNYDFTHHPTLMRIYGGAFPSYDIFTPGQIMRSVLAQAIYNGLGKKVTDTLYYFPDTLEKHTDGSSTVYTYNVETQSLDQVDTQDVEDYRKQYLSEYRNSNPQANNYSGNSQYSQRYPEMYPSKKKGGILKAQGGAQLIGNIGHTDDYNYYQHGISNWINDLLESAKNAQDKKAFAKLVNDTQHAHSLLASRWDGNNAYLGTNNDVGNYQQGIINNFGYVNTKGIQSITDNNYYTYPTNPMTSDNSKNNWNPDNYYAAQTDDRRVLGRRVTKEDGTVIDDFTPEQLQSLTKQFADRGYEMYLDDSDNYYKLSLLDGDKKIQQLLDEANRDLNLNNRPTEPYKLKWDEMGSEDKDTKEYNLKTGIDEVYTKTRDSLGSKPSMKDFWGELGPDLLGAGRLAGSILANNRIAKTVRDSLRPKLHNTYELYSPVTGAFSEMQLRNRQGAETLSQAYRPFTSDASLAAARMLEGQRHANDLQYQGFIANDREIKRTQEEALKRQEGNIARRSDLANSNRDAIIDTNQAKAQLEASRIKQNWNSIDNYLQGVEGRVRNRIAENRERYNQFALQTSSASADQSRREAINSLRDIYEKWKAADSSRANLTFTDWATQNSESYAKAMQDINAVTEALKYRGYANVYGLGYDWPTWKDQNGNEVPISFDVNSGRYKWLKFGGHIELNASQLIDKVIKNNNEGSS